MALRWIVEICFGFRLIIKNDALFKGSKLQK